MSNPVGPLRYFDAAVNNKYPDFEYGEYEGSDNIVKRVTELGINSTNKDVLNTDRKQFKVLEDRVWELAPNVKESMSLHEDYLNAINFLEVFALYADSHNSIVGSKNEMNLLTKTVSLGRDSRVDFTYNKAVLKLLKELEDLRSILVNHTPTNSIELKAKVKAIKKNVDKVYNNDLGRTEKIAFAEIINTAKGILSKYYIAL